MQNSMVMLTFSLLDRIYLFLANLVQKIKIFCLSWNFVPRLFEYQEIMQNWIAMFTFSVLNRKYPFWTNLMQNIKIVCLTWNFVPRLNNGMCWIRWWCSRFLLKTWNTLFIQIWFKMLKLAVKVEMWYKNQIK